MSAGWRRALVFVVPLAVYLAPDGLDRSADARPSRYLPLSLAREGNFDLDEFPFLAGPDGVLPYYLTRSRGHVVSSFSPGPSLLALPVFLVPALAGVNAASRWPLVLERVAAAVIAAGSAFFLFLAASAVASERAALAAAAVYAFGTSTFSVSSQALWEHGPAQLMIAVALWLVARAERVDEPGAALALATAVAMRPTVILLAAPFAASFARSPRRSRALFLAAAPLGLLALYDRRYFGLPWSTGRDHILGGRFWSAHVLNGLLGVLASPSRGLFVYSPVLLLSCVALAAGWRRSALWRAIGIGTALLVGAVACRLVWWGGWCFGPRLLAEAAPGLCLALAPIVDAAGPWVRRVLVALAVPSIAIHALGAFFYDGSWDKQAFVERDPSYLWSWSDSPIRRDAAVALGLPARVRGALLVGLVPSSLDAVDGLAASYRLVEAPPRAVAAGRPFELRVRATNVGRSFWLARTNESVGAVRLAARWTCAGTLLPDTGERVELAAPVLPGASQDFRARFAAPPTAGDCVLSLGLVSEFRATFADLGTMPLSWPMRIEPPPPASRVE